MGNRANYVLIEDGQSRLYFSRWGAPDIPGMLLAGPEAAIAYVHALTPDDDLQDEVWAEGGVVLDADLRDLRFFGGVHIENTPYMRRPLLRALRAVWPGWRVAWARFGIADLALSLGRDVRLVLNVEDDPEWLPDTGRVIQDGDIQTTDELTQARSIFSVRWDENEVRDYLLVPPSASALALGPRLLDLLRTARPATLPREDAPDLPHDGAYLDTTTRSLWMSGTDRVYLLHLWATAQRWPGWQVDGHTEGLARQVALSGRDPAAVVVSEEQAIHELIDELTRTYSIDPAGLYEALVKRDDAPLASSDRITFGKGFFSDDRPLLSKEEQRALLLRLLRETASPDDFAPPAD